jgi:hypothetical protein
LLLGLLPVLLGGCTETVVQDREPFNPPPDATNKFLGLFTTADTLTTCGNCHVEHQKDWRQTAHASAYGLPATSPDVKPECYTCHTVSDKGNATAFPAGWDAVPDTVYHGVQCENCHGPGLDHVMAPDAVKSASNPPLAHIGLLGSDNRTGPDSPVTIDSASAAQSCGACHNQNSGPGVRAFEEWAASGHAVQVLEANGTSPADNPACQSCHEGKGVLAAWGVTANYAEKGQTGHANQLAQTCAVCHDPHGTAQDPATGKPIEGQLRFSLSAADVNQNLCMKCHQRRSVPDQASSRGPHSPQGPMLLGDAGYQNPTYLQVDLVAVATTHGSEKNPRLCAGCHVNRLTGTDVTTGKPATSAGHLFLPNPCLDAGGLPDLVNQDCPDDEVSRSWAACTASGCHGSAAVAVSLFALSTTRIEQLVEPIWFDKNANDAIDPDSTACSAGRLRIRSTGTPAVVDSIPCANPTGVTATDDYNRANWDGGLLARTNLIPIIGPTVAFPADTNQYRTNDNRITAAEGARFNVRMLREGGADGSNGVHNPFLAEALLRANIAELGDVYFGGSPPLPVSVQSIMQGPLGSVTKRPAAQWLRTRPISSR